MALTPSPSLTGGEQPNMSRGDDLAVILVAWNVRTIIQNALRMLYADLQSSGLQTAVWVVDNLSSDGTAEAIRTNFPMVNLIEPGRNLGFAAGNNVALRRLGFHDQPTTNPGGPRAIFVLNPDTLIQPGAIRALYDALFGLPKAGCVGAQLNYEDGTFQHSAFRFPGLWQIMIDLFPLPHRLHGRLYESRLNGRYPRRSYAAGQPFPVDHTLGATMMLRREVIEQTGLFDEQFFMYCEEIDWSMRIWQAGWKIYNVPTAYITHLEARSTNQIKPQSVINLWISRLRLYTKHYSGLKLALARSLIRLGMGWQIRKAQRMPSLSHEQREALVNAYKQVMSL